MHSYVNLISMSKSTFLSIINGIFIQFQSLGIDLSIPAATALSNILNVHINVITTLQVTIIGNFGLFAKALKLNAAHALKALGSAIQSNLQTVKKLEPSLRTTNLLSIAIAELRATLNTSIGTIIYLLTNPNGVLSLVINQISC